MLPGYPLNINQLPLKIKQTTEIESAGRDPHTIPLAECRFGKNYS